ncbi:metallophosphoesterase [Rubrivivax gelatinosus]|uniref:DNA repair exonuclease n=1 Tax=Rubrivivax gelatinosus TaxID=28068 RepID=A0ABS1DXE2_RUBGE|nr:DNA repair exonuclease [Rubrivivax gelatinosus]
MSVLLHVSDTHFGTERAPVVEALVAFAHALRPDLVVLSGDITQRARRAQFRAARLFVDRLGSPFVAIPGNHDIALFDLASRWLRPYAAHMESFGTELEPVHDSADCLLQCVNTTRPRRHKNGEVSALQIERVAARLAAARRGQLRIVVVHQPVAVSRDEDLPNLLRGHAQALRRWAEAGCDLVLGGHIHLPYVVPLLQLARPLWVVQAGTAVSHRVRDGIPNSVNVLRWGREVAPGSCLIERWDHGDEGRFVRRGVTEAQPARG